MAQPQKQFFIYKPCKFWSSPSGHCKRGDNCRFIHDVRSNIHQKNVQVQTPLPLPAVQETKNNVAYFWKSHFTRFFSIKHGGHANFGETCYMDKIKLTFITREKNKSFAIEEMTKHFSKEKCDVENAHFWGGVRSNIGSSIYCTEINLNDKQFEGHHIGQFGYTFSREID